MTVTESSHIFAPPEPEAPPELMVSPPANVEAEKAVLGCVLINPHCLYDLAPFLRRSHFFIQRHGWIWEAFVRLDERRVAIDVVTVSDELTRRGQLDEIGAGYLYSLVTVVPTTLNALSYGRVVEEAAIRRQMITSASRIAALAYDENRPVEDCISEASQQVADLQVLSSGHELTALSDLFSQTVDTIEERARNPKEIWGLATGLPTFDKETGGLQIGEMVYLAGAPGIGKTWLDLGWAMEFGKQEPGAIFSLEMKKRAIGRRILSGVSGVSTRNMKSGFLADGDWDALLAAQVRYSGHPVYVDDSTYDTHRLRSTLAWARREYGIRWFMLDYALLLTDPGRDETEQTKVISANMKRIVQDLDLCGVILHSVTKVSMGGGEDEPRQSDQRGSGQAIHDADMQLFLTKLYEKDPAATMLTIDERNRMATLWCSKGRELEKSKFKTHLVRQGHSPFWGEYVAVTRSGREPNQSVNYDER